MIAVSREYGLLPDEFLARVDSYGIAELMAAYNLDEQDLNKKKKRPERESDDDDTGTA